ncbi:MAG TPA: hypothetical protein VJT67_15785, partial [Longimicrobiaceae bacterium]|nr:hypothetical protein [Longimicrobiaceae bacterium]
RPGHRALIHARATTVRRANPVPTPHPVPPATRTAAASARPLSADQVRVLTGVQSVLTPVTLSTDHRSTDLAWMEYFQAEEVGWIDKWVVFDKTTFAPLPAGPQVTVNAVAGRKYLLDFVFNWFNPREMRVKLPDGEQTATFNQPGTHHVTVMVDATVTGPYAVQLHSTQGEWLFISCTVTPLQ